MKYTLLRSTAAALVLAAATSLSLAGDSSARLESVLAVQDEETQARYQYRHPRETLEFFGIEPGMTVVEALPGAGWYSKILANYLGSEGHLIGANYAYSIFPRFGFFSDEQLEGLKTWEADWPVSAQEWRGDDAASISAFSLGSMPDEFKGEADAVLFIRAMHNLVRFEGEGNYMTDSLQDAFDALKPGGILGVVQHRAPDSSPDEWAGGAAGYLKKGSLIARIEQAGFEFVAESNINENPKDQPGENDVVWRLAPTFAGTEEGTEAREQVAAIGESNRMTLKFRKP